MNPVALYLASGESLYGGAILLLIVLGMSGLVRHRWLVRLRNLGAWAGVALMLLACAPFAWWVYGLFLGAFLAWFMAWNARPRRGVRVGTAVGLALLVILLSALELSYRSGPVLVGDSHARLVVIGDSISAGIDARDPWPAVLEKRDGVAVKNLSRPAIGVREAVEIARQVGAGDTLVLVEIGGNDLLSDLPAAEFEQLLGQALARLDAPKRTVLMFELPLLPHKIAYGRIQRRLAAQHRVVLIPKRYFIDVLTGPDSTSDGLHLSPAGAQGMAAMVAQLVRPVLSSSSLKKGN